MPLFQPASSTSRDMSTTQLNPLSHAASTDIAASLGNAHVNLFSDAPIPILIEDWSKVFEALMALQGNGVTDIDRYFDEHPQAVGELRKLHRFVDANQAVVRLCDADSRAHFLTKAHELLPADRTSNSAVYRAMFKRRTDCQGEHTLVTFSGRTVSIIWRCSLPDSLEGYRRLFFYAFDVTEQKGNSARLEALRAETARASRVSLFGELAASILHEIGQPLAGARTSSDAALRWLVRDDPEIEEAVSAIRAARRWTQDATEICRKIRGFLGKEPVKSVPFDPTEAIDSALCLVSPEASAKGISIETNVALALKVFADPLQVQQVLVNLLLNGIQSMDFNSANPQTLSLSVQADGAGSVLFEVRDSGCGIDSEMRQSLFQPFSTTKEGGIGMGLATARSIVEGHGGRIWVESAPLQGSRFRFTLPADHTTRSSSEP
jgi:two-component system, LuxR family, sensor kinase FixL